MARPFCPRLKQQPATKMEFLEGILGWTSRARVCDTILVSESGKCQTTVMARLEININKLSPEERLGLIEELWDSLSADPSKIPLTDAQAKELDRRMAEMDQDDTLGIPWETVLAQIRERK